VGASERDEFPRLAWRVLVRDELDASHFVFVDEMGSNTSLSPLYGWSRRGERAFFKAPRNWGKNVTLLSSMSLKGMGPSLAVEGPTTREVFEAYVEKVLAPSLKRGRVVVMDKGQRVGELIESGGCELPYPPPYSPDLNPIEEAFSKVKGILRKARARTREALIEAIGVALTAVSASDTRGFFEHCGYRTMVQPF
jgi:transposase